MHPPPPEPCREIRLEFEGDRFMDRGKPLSPFDEGVADRLAATSAVRIVMGGRVARDAFHGWWQSLRPCVAPPADYAAFKAEFLERFGGRIVTPTLAAEVAQFVHRPMGQGNI